MTEPTLEQRMYAALDKLTPEGREFVGLYNEYIANLIAQNLLHVMEAYAPRLAPQPHELAPIIRQAIIETMHDQLIPLSHGFERMRGRMRRIEWLLILLIIAVIIIAARVFVLGV